MKPWLTDPKYGGMSELAARRSYEAWVKQGRKTLPVKPPAESDEQIALRLLQIETMLAEYKTAIEAFAAWMAGWRARRRISGFRALRRNKETQA